MQNDTTERSATAKKSLLDGWNAPPNLVTYSRIVLVVIFLGLYIAAGSWGENNIPMRWAAAVLFIVAASTDKVDGWMARKYNQVTELGKLMDPIADKLLTCATLIVAAVFGELGPVWLGWIIVALFLLREVGITVMRFFVIDKGGKVIAAAWPGKLKTLFQCIGLSMLLLPCGVQSGPDRAGVDDGILHADVRPDIHRAAAVPVFGGDISDQHVREPQGLSEWTPSCLRTAAFLFDGV